MFNMSKLTFYLYIDLDDDDEMSIGRFYARLDFR